MSNQPEDAGSAPSQWVTVGRCGAPYGVKGWLRISSDTDPRDAIFGLGPWQVTLPAGARATEIEAWREHGRHLVAKLVGIDTPEAVDQVKGQSIQVARRSLPAPEADEYYWCDLIGLRVVTETGDDLGEVVELFETGSNDVMVIGEPGHLVPFVVDQVVKDVDFETGIICVDWDVNY